MPNITPQSGEIRGTTPCWGISQEENSNPQTAQALAESLTDAHHTEHNPEWRAQSRNIPQSTIKKHLKRFDPDTGQMQAFRFNVRASRCEVHTLFVYSRMEATKKGMQSPMTPGRSCWLSQASSTAVWKSTRAWHVNRHAAKQCWSFACNHCIASFYIMRNNSFNPSTNTHATVMRYSCIALIATCPKTYGCLTTAT